MRLHMCFNFCSRLFLVMYFICTAGQSLAQQKSTLDVQSIQTRTYEYSEKGTFRAVLSVLQNRKFERIFSDSNGGLITASLPSLMAGDTADEQVGKSVAAIAIGSVIPFGGLLTPERKSGAKERSISITVEEIAKNETSVRILLKETETIYKTGFLGATSQEVNDNDMTSRPEIYQKIFSEIDKEIFIRLNNK
jgi:hypothetical protein